MTINKPKILINEGGLTARAILGQGGKPVYAINEDGSQTNKRDRPTLLWAPASGKDGQATTMLQAGHQLGFDVIELARDPLYYL